MSIDLASIDGAHGLFSATWLLVAIPLFSGGVLLVGGRRTDKWGHYLGVAAPLASFVLGVVLFFSLLGKHGDGRRIDQHLFTWTPVAGFHANANFLIDPLSICFVLLITGVGSLIHIYSVGYMAHDPGRRRFFAYLNLFVAAMLLLVLGDNFVALYFGWEGVGVASYLLIGFWSYKPSAATAAKKAFVVNRVGDFGLSIAIMLMFATFGSFSFADVAAGAADRIARDDDLDRAAAAARRVWQVGPGAAAVVARRRHGRPDAGVGAHPRRHDGDRRRLPRSRGRTSSSTSHPMLGSRSRSSAPSRWCSVRSSVARRTTSRRRWRPRR